MKVEDLNTKKTLGPNENGEICVKSPTIMKGYWKRPAETQAVYDGNGWFHTGMWQNDEHFLSCVCGSKSVCLLCCISF